MNDDSDGFVDEQNMIEDVHVDMQPFKNDMERNDTLVRIGDIKQSHVDVSEADLDVIDLDSFELVKDMFDFFVGQRVTCIGTMPTYSSFYHDLDFSQASNDGPIIKEIHENDKVKDKSPSGNLLNCRKVARQNKKCNKETLIANRDILAKAVQQQMQKQYQVDENPDTILRIDVHREPNPESPTRTFRRIYVCLGALKKGFKVSGRDILGLGGCFIKGPYPGQILTIVGVDANNGIYLVAYAIVEAETKSSRCRHLKLLRLDLDIDENSNFTFISDKQKVIYEIIQAGIAQSQGPSQASITHSRRTTQGTRSRQVAGPSQGAWRNEDNSSSSMVVPKESAPKVVESANNKKSENGSGTSANVGKSNSEKAWKISKENAKKLKKSANKYVVLFNDENGSNAEEEFVDKILIVDEFIRKNLQPTCSESKNWTYDMMEYFKYQWVAIEGKARTGEVDSDDEDVMVNQNAYIQNIIANEVLGTKCGIIIGWNPHVVDLMVIHSSCQEVLCLVEDVQRKVRLHVSFIYVPNSNGERKVLWNQLQMSKSIVSSHTWIDAINGPEIDDICSLGFFYTWTKSLKNPQNSTLKKLDRIMGNDAFVANFIKAHGVFLPFMVSDHSPAMLILPEGLPKKKTSFRFVNYIVDKSNFLDVVKQGWDQNIKGCHMFKVVKRMKYLKKPLNDLNWQNGNLFDNINWLNNSLKMLKVSLRLILQLKQKIEVVRLVNKYNEVAEDELKLLHQTAKIKWLKEGDRNSTYFHSVLKDRKHKNRVESICGEDGVRYIRSELKLSVEDANEMITEVTDAEIKDALFDIDSSKVAGPDGILKEVNATLIELVPKIDTPNKSAFIPGRHIQDNILITQELLKGYKRKQGAKRCAMKIDIQKAYDTISWDFLKEVLIQKAGDFAKGKERVAWSMVCRPKDQGGLGIKPLEKWNEVMRVTHIWKVLADKDQGWKNLLDLRIKLGHLFSIKWEMERKLHCGMISGAIMALFAIIFQQGLFLRQDSEHKDNLECALCKTEVDNHSHLFFNCPYPSKVWKSVQSKSYLCSRGQSFQNIVDLLASKAFKNNIIHIVDRLILSAFVYFIWNERNKRMFTNCSRAEDELVGCIKNNVRDMMKCLKVRKSFNVLMVDKRWGLK
ncbi:RNA-directed DNA polymerase, eukaryota, reverse transcriptase zinc-binding domain protein [Tanacetum coccineum]